MDLTHFNDSGGAKMVNVGDKTVTQRTAVASGRVYVNPETMALIHSGGIKKGDVLGVAQVGGIMGAKRTPDIIPMCHPVMLSGVDLGFSLNDVGGYVEITATASCSGQTGVEMEAMTAVSVAALTIYDMCKAVQKDMVIGDIRLMEKHGGKSGDFYSKGRVLAVCISDKKGEQKHELECVFLKPEHGIEGDAHAGTWHRQVSLLGIESVRKVQENITFTLQNGAFAENILTEGLTLFKLPVGTRLKIGEALTEVTQIGKECHTACAIREAAGDCVMPREGIFVKVLEGGAVKAGDEITVLGEYR